MDTVFAGYLSYRFATLKFGHDRYLEFSVVAPSYPCHLLPSKRSHLLTHCLLGGVQSTNRVCIVLMRTSLYYRILRLKATNLPKRAISLNN
jgi:hypothetical protein